MRCQPLQPAKKILWVCARTRVWRLNRQDESGD
jgi:hypothetical protein